MKLNRKCPMNIKVLIRSIVLAVVALVLLNLSTALAKKADNIFLLEGLKAHLEEMVSTGANYVRNTMSQREGVELKAHKLLDNGKFDMDRWNPEYWKRFENCLKWTLEWDIIMQIEVWDRFDYSQEQWDHSPWNPANNINYDFAQSGLARKYPAPAWRDRHPFFHTIPGMAQYKPVYDLIRKHQERFVAKMAAVIGRTDDAKKYGRLFEGIKAAFNEKYVEPDGRIEGNTQAGYALALQFNLLPEPLRPKAAKHMVNEFERYNGHMSTGIQTSHRLMLELMRNGYNNEAYRLLNLRTFPSWGFMIEQGATTIWERWDGYVKGHGFQEPMMNSFNHWALGSVGEWIWRCLIGINPDESSPGYKHFTIEPELGEDITWARGEYNSIHGVIISDWRLENGNFRLDVTVPPNTTATAYLPAKDAKSVTIDGKVAAELRLVHFLGIKDGKAAFAVNSGRYQFVSLMSRLKRSY